MQEVKTECHNREGYPVLQILTILLLRQSRERVLNKRRRKTFLKVWKTSLRLVGSTVALMLWQTDMDHSVKLFLLLFVPFWQVYYKPSGDTHYQVHVAGNVLSYETGSLTGGETYTIQVRTGLERDVSCISNLTVTR